VGRAAGELAGVRRIGPVAVAALLVLLAGCGGTTAAAATAPTWQYQLQGTVDTTVDAAVFDVDLFDTPASTDWRPDVGSFPEAVRGDPLDGWPGERWLDVRQLGVLEPVLAARMDLCRQKGFDGVEPDNVDGYANDSGFDLTAADQLAFNRMLARLAHDRGLEVGLKNDLDQVDALAPDFDFAVNEQCLQYDECDALEPFVAVGKPVYHVEYEIPLSRMCPPPPGFSSIRKKIDLGPGVETCAAA
jgi:hypothetical protein